MQTIKINVVGKVATADGNPFIVCGNSDYTILFNFDAAWDGQNIKTARFSYEQDGEEVYQEVVFEGNSCQAPVIKNAKRVDIGVYAGDILSTTRCRINCKASILCGEEIEHEEPPEDVYNTIMETVNQMYERILAKKDVLKAGSAYTASWEEVGPARFKVPNAKVGDTVKLSFDFAVNLDGLTEDIKTRIVTNKERILWPVFKQYNADGTVKKEMALELNITMQGTISQSFTVGDTDEFFRIIIRSASGLKDSWELSNFTVTPTYDNLETIGSTTVGGNAVYDAPINLDFSDGLNYWLNVGTTDNPKVVLVAKGADIGEVAVDQAYNPESKNAQSGIAVAEALVPLVDELYNIRTADNVKWVQGSVYNGVLDTTNLKAISTNYINIAKGTFKFSTNLLARITYYDSEKNYVSNTGDFKTITSYDVPDDGYIRISIGRDSANTLPEEGNSAAIQFRAQPSYSNITSLQNALTTTNNTVATVQGDFETLQKEIEGDSNSILKTATWTPGFYYANGTTCNNTTEAGLNQILYYGYAARSSLIQVTPGSILYYKLKAPLAGRLGTDTNWEITFCEFTASKGWIRRNIIDLNSVSSSQITTSNGFEIVQGSFKCGADTGYVAMVTRTFRADYDGSQILAVYTEKPGGSKLLPSVNATDNGKVLKVVGGAWTAVADQALSGDFSYTGEAMPSKVKTNYFNSTHIFTMTGSNLTSQDAEIYGDYYFVACSKTEQIRVYSLYNNSHIADIPIAVHHGAGCQFSNEFYEEYDELPLLYVGGGVSNNANLISVIRIVPSDDGWTAEVIRTLSISGTNGYWLAPSIDAKNNILYTYGYSINSYTDTSASAKLLQFDLDVLTQNDDGTYTPKGLRSMTLPRLGVTQGRKFYDGNLYIAFAETTAPHNSRLVTIDCASGLTKNTIDLTGITTSEAEGLCYRIIGDNIYWYLNEYWKVFKLKF